jgi:hypothetical protein
MALLNNYKNKHRLFPLSRSTHSILISAMQLVLFSNPLSAKEGIQAFESSAFQQAADNGAQTHAKKSVKK